MIGADEDEPDAGARAGRLVPSEATARYIGHSFGVDTDLTLTEAARGLTGRVWRLGTAGPRYALKELFWDDDQDEDEISWRVDFEAAARQVGVRCPQSLPTGAGTYLCRLPPAHGGVYVRLYTWIDGTALASARDAAPWLGDTLARLHRLHRPPAGAPSPKYEVVPTSTDWQAVTSALHREGVPWTGRLEATLPTIEDLTPLVTQLDRAELIACHLDLTPANVMRDRTGGLLLLDWDNAGPGSPEHELAGALMDWHVHAGQPDPNAIDATMTAYRNAGGPAQTQGLRSFSAYLSARINHLYTQARVAIAPDVLPEHQVLAHTKVDEVLRSFPSPALLHHVAELATPQPP